MNKFVEQVFIAMGLLFMTAMYIDALLEYATGEPFPGLHSILIAGMLGVQTVDHMRRGNTFADTMLFGGVGAALATVGILIAF